MIDQPVTWTIDILETDVIPQHGELTDVMVWCDWQIDCSLTSGEMVRRVYRAVLDPPDSDNFTDWNQLTREQVISWIPPADIEAVKPEMLAELEKKLDPTLPVMKEAAWKIYPYRPHRDEYAMFIEGQHVWGPALWSGWNINEVLERLDRSERVSLDDEKYRKEYWIPINQPRAVSESVVIYRAYVEANPDDTSDTLFYDRHKVEWLDFSQGVARGRYITGEQPLDVVRIHLRERVNQLRRDNCYMDFLIPSQNVTVRINVDVPTMIDIRDPDNLFLYTQDGWIYPITVEENAALNAAVTQHLTYLNSKTAEYHRRIREAQDLAQLIAIDLKDM